jgi:hypothetical protein
MKVLSRFAILMLVFFSLFASAEAVPVEIVSGGIFISGTAYDTPEYQTYLNFYMVGQTRMPRRNYIMRAEQRDSVYLDHPVQPAGDYEYKVQMPYHGSSFTINDEMYFPVWYVGCIWKFQTSIQTPDAPPNAPQFKTVSAPFRMDGSSNFYGAYSTGFRVKGRGTAELKFEKIGTKYYVREATYTFTDKF